jgi:hypothetical protein
LIPILISDAFYLKIIVADASHPGMALGQEPAVHHA